MARARDCDFLDEVWELCCKPAGMHRWGQPVVLSCYDDCGNAQAVYSVPQVELCERAAACSAHIAITAQNDPLTECNGCGAS